MYLYFNKYKYKVQKLPFCIQHKSNCFLYTTFCQMASTEMYAFLQSKLEVLHDLSLHVNEYCFNCVANVLFESLDSPRWIGFLYFRLKIPHKKKSQAVKSEKRGSYEISPFREMTRLGNKIIHSIHRNSRCVAGFPVLLKSIFSFTVKLANCDVIKLRVIETYP